MVVYDEQKGIRYHQGFLRVAEGEDQESYGMFEIGDKRGDHVTEVLRWKLEEDKVEAVKEWLEKEFRTTYGLGLWTICEAAYDLNSRGLVSADVPDDVEHYLGR